MIIDNLNLLFKLKTDLETKLFQSFYIKNSPLFDKLTYEHVAIDIKTKLIPLVGFEVTFSLALTKNNYICVLFNSSNINIDKGTFIIEYRDITTRDSFKVIAIYSFKEEDSEIEKAVNDICQFFSYVTH